MRTWERTGTILSDSGISGKHWLYQCDPREILRKLQSDPSDRSGTFEAMSLLW